MKVIETKQGMFLICNDQETIQRSLLESGQFEINIASIAASILNYKAGAIVDVGANIGVFSVPIGASFRDRKVLCYEPQKNVFHHLCTNLTLNRLSNVFADKLAIGLPEQNTEVDVPDFDIFEERYTGSVSLDRGVIELRATIENVAEPDTYASTYQRVPIKALDDLVGDIHIALIKVDVEGMEQEVLTSASRVLRNDCPALIFEAWNLEQFDGHNQALFSFVKDMGFTIWRFNNNCVALHEKDQRLAKKLDFLVDDRII